LVQPLICEAIRKRAVLEFEYDGLPRIVVPYCHGMSTAGHELLRAVQIGGASASRGFQAGKLWTVAKMRQVSIARETFLPNDPQYNPNDSAMASIHCRV
jgi:hypothetical protein